MTLKKLNEIDLEKDKLLDKLDDSDVVCNILTSENVLLIVEVKLQENELKKKKKNHIKNL